MARPPRQSSAGDPQGINSWATVDLLIGQGLTRWQSQAAEEGVPGSAFRVGHQSRNRPNGRSIGLEVVHRHEERGFPVSGL
jgi:hypothetical protein